jgi:hypothetical protein
VADSTNIFAVPLMNFRHRHHCLCNGVQWEVSFLILALVGIDCFAAYFSAKRENFCARREDSFPLAILSVDETPKIIQNAQGELAITMDIFDQRGTIAEIVKNEFRVNDNNYFTMVRRDRSELIVFGRGVDPKPRRSPQFYVFVVGALCSVPIASKFTAVSHIVYPH